MTTASMCRNVHLRSGTYCLFSILSRLSLYRCLVALPSLQIDIEVFYLRQVLCNFPGWEVEGRQRAIHLAIHLLTSLNAIDTHGQH